MEIPKKIIDGLVSIILSGYEWRLVMVIIQQTYSSDKESAEISLDAFYNKTKIKKPHLSRSLSMLQERNVVRKRMIDGKMTWAFNHDTDKWRSYLDFKIPNPIPKRIEIAWENWIEMYPYPMNEMFREDAKAMYVNLVMQDKELIEKLDDCLKGYIKLSVYRAKKANRDPDELMIMYPTSFLRNKTWENFDKFKYLNKKENW